LEEDFDYCCDHISPYGRIKINFDQSRDGLLGEICSLFIIEGLDSVNLDGFREEFGEIRFFLTFVGKHRFVSAGTRSPVTIEEQDSSGFCTEFTHDDFGDGRLSYTLHLRSYRSEDSCKALSLYSENLLIPISTNC